MVAGLYLHLHRSSPCCRRIVFRAGTRWTARAVGCWHLGCRTDGDWGRIQRPISPRAAGFDGWTRGTERVPGRTYPKAPLRALVPARLGPDLLRVSGSRGLGVGLCRPRSVGGPEAKTGAATSVEQIGPWHACRTSALVLNLEYYASTFFSRGGDVRDCPPTEALSIDLVRGASAHHNVRRATRNHGGRAPYRGPEAGRGTDWRAL